ncbi:MAG: bifunctional DNA-formamidopyrimidine glycosylase/DNA-(apurinic or apyrimidinic site) lyase [Calditrichota bacterium]
MPELPEVESLRLELHERAVGERVTLTEVYLPRIIRAGDLSDLQGRTIKSTGRRGKYLWFELDDGAALFAHMGMTGTLLCLEHNAPLPSHTRARIALESGQIVYRDARTLGGLWVSRPESPPWKKLGWDPLNDKIKAGAVYRLLQRRSAPIKLALLDQAVIAGIGNIYACEALFQAGIDPRRPAHSLSRPKVRKLVDCIIDRLQAALASKGTTFRDFRLSDGREGEFAQFLKVYGKTDKPCSVCSKPIQRIIQAGRSTFFCPRCQK